MKLVYSSDATMMSVAQVQTEHRGFVGRSTPAALSHCARCHGTFDANYPVAGSSTMTSVNAPQMTATQTSANADEVQEVPGNYVNSYDRGHPDYMNSRRNAVSSGTNTTDPDDIQDECAEALERGHIESCTDLQCDLAGHQRDECEDAGEDKDEDERDMILDPCTQDTLCSHQLPSPTPHPVTHPAHAHFLPHSTLPPFLTEPDLGASLRNRSKSAAPFLLCPRVVLSLAPLCRYPNTHSNPLRKSSRSMCDGL